MLFDKIKTDEVNRLIREYDPLSVAVALLASSLWLPNISAQVKHRFFVLVFLSISPREFRRKEEISSYEQFSSFCEELYCLAPEFTTLEDHTPAQEWGAVRYFYDGKAHKIFYECDLGAPNEYLDMFQMLHSKFDSIYRKKLNRSPLRDLEEMLISQDAMISAVHRPEEKPIDSPGVLEVPSKSFWGALVEHLKSKAEKGHPSVGFVRSFTVELGRFAGDASESVLSPYLENSVSAGFVNVEGTLVPLLPRDWIAVLYDDWGEQFESLHQDLPDLQETVTAAMYEYAVQRFPEQALLPEATPLDTNGRPSFKKFDLVLLGEEGVVLVLVPAPGPDLEKLLSDVKSDVEAALEQLRKPGSRLGSLWLRKAIELTSSGSAPTSLKLVTVVFQTSSQGQAISIPSDFPGTVTFLDEFLAILDEAESPGQLLKFLNFFVESGLKNSSDFVSLLDAFAAFLETNGVLTTGAIKPSWVGLEPLWGAKFRFEALSRFWSLYPAAGVFGHPRMWRLSVGPADTTRIISRSSPGALICVRVKNAECLLTSPIFCMSPDQSRMSEIVVEILEDYLARYSNQVEVDPTISRVRVTVFPESLVASETRFSHLKHLAGSRISVDSSLQPFDRLEVRLVFSDVILADELSAAETRSTEIDVMSAVLIEIKNWLLEGSSGVFLALEEERAKPPRFKVVRTERKVDFPESVELWISDEEHIKRGIRKVAELGLSLSLKPGRYELKVAVEILNKLRLSLVQEIEMEIGKLKYFPAVTTLLTQHGALVHRRENHRAILEMATTQDIDYDLEGKFSSEEREFFRSQRQFQYLIEKIVSKEPDGHCELTKDNCQYLLALADRLRSIYDASDQLHYEIDPVGIEIDEDFRLTVLSLNPNENREETVLRGIASRVLGSDGGDPSPESPEEVLRKIDAALMADADIRLSTVIHTLSVLSLWASLASVQEKAVQSSSEESIAAIVVESFPQEESNEVQKAIQFLTLKPSEVCRLADGTQCVDVPVWEYRKRSARYAVRPLLKLGSSISWGTYGAYYAARRWSEEASSGQLAIEIGGEETRKVLDQYRSVLSKDLVRRVEKVLKKDSQQVETEVYLHKRDRKGGHPLDLGDYDVLAYSSERRIVFCIECKDLSPAYCAKDAKRLRERIFSEAVPRVERRGAYFRRNIQSLSRHLGWELGSSQPRVVSVFVHRRELFWTRVPPANCGVHFVQVDQLTGFISSL